MDKIILFMYESHTSIYEQFSLVASNLPSFVCKLPESFVFRNPYLPGVLYFIQRKILFIMCKKRGVSVKTSIYTLVFF